MESNLSYRINDAFKLAIKDKIEKNLLFELANDCMANQSDQESSHKFLELAHLSNVSKLINERNKTEEWFDIIHKIIVFSNFHFGFLLRQRSIKYKNKIETKKWIFFFYFGFFFSRKTFTLQKREKNSQNQKKSQNQKNKAKIKK